MAILATIAVIFTWIRLVGARGSPWIWGLLPIFATGAFVPAMLWGHTTRHPLLPTLTRLSAIAVGFLSFALVAAAVAWLVALVCRGVGRPSAVRPLAELVFALAGVVAAYGLANSVVPRTTRLRVALPHLPAAWGGRTVALISDIHLGNVRSAAFVRHLVRRLNRARPEAVFISGDMFDGTKIDLRSAASDWSGLKAPRGAYFVTGNHDERGMREAYCAALARTGIRILNNEMVELDGLQVVGIHDAEIHSPEIYRELLLKAKVSPDKTCLLLAHQPVNLDVPERAGIHLQLSGHTHGGQFWPWSLIARRVHGKFVYGLNRHRRMLIYTSSGAGTWGPPFRVGTRSEIVLLQLEPASPETNHV
ncbi:MAG TPA: metallophosphoesterase [Opitutaceae bacterium]